MTEKQMISTLKGLTFGTVVGSKGVEALDMAIQALSQEPICDRDCEHCTWTECPIEPCDDAISREAVLKIIDKWYENKSDIEDLIILITYMASVTQKSVTWIPVNERLPEDEQEILFSTKTGRVHSGKYHDDDSANQWYSHRDKCRAWNNVVTAWMPLPKPYEPKESEVEE